MAQRMDDFGGKLRQARERRGMSLRQIAASTRIPAAALDALEKNDLSRLPGGIFSRAFVRSYALEVGLDPDETVREFLVHFSEETAQTAAALPTAPPDDAVRFDTRRRQAVKVLALGVGLLLVLAAAGYLAVRRRVAILSTTPGTTSQESIRRP